MLWESGSFTGTPFGAIFPSPETGFVHLPPNIIAVLAFSMNMKGWSAKKYEILGADI